MREVVSAMANHIPLVLPAIAVLIPMTFPSRLKRGHHEFQGLIAASVCMRFERRVHSASILLFFPLTIPSDTEF